MARAWRDQAAICEIPPQAQAALPGSACALTYPSAVIDEASKAAPRQLDSVEKAIRDFDDLVQAMRKSLVPGKTWQRQLITDLTQIDRLTQVLRMTRSMGRDSVEVVAATDRLLSALRVAQQRVATGRADQVTRAAMMLASELGMKISAALA